MSEFSSKLPNIETSIFAVMSKLAFEHDAINLSQGYPDFPSSSELIELVNKAMMEGYNQYAPMQGIYSLREVISNKILKLHGHQYDPVSEITLTAGATQAIYTAISACVRPGDEVIIFGPSYDSYEPSVRLNGGNVIEIELEYPEFAIDWQEVQKAINKRTRMLIINSPHNPTGKILTKQDMLQLQSMLDGTDVLVLSDEVYEHIIFDGLEHQSISRFEGLAERSFVVASFGKTFHNTGWKMGYCAAPRKLMTEFQKVHQFNVFSVNHPIQRALAIYLDNAANYLDLGPFFQKKRDVFLKALEGTAFSFTPSQGTYFQLLNYARISQESDRDLAERWTKEFKVASIPVSAFYLKRTDAKILRFCFAKQDETLLKGADILKIVD